VAVYDGSRAVEEFSNQYDLLILDIDTPKKSGLEVLKESVKFYPALPVLMISATIEIDTIVKAYNIGCSDYVKKPFDILELEMKIKHLLKHNNPLVVFENGLTFNLVTEAVYIYDQEVDLTQKERKLFSYLVKNRGINISQDSLSFYIWNEDIEKSNIRQLVSRVRKKIPDDMITNSFGNGYCLK
jgi:DNA-binding response OmpR family regulator